MGYNTVVFICNDAMESIKNDPAGFVDKVIEGTSRVTYKMPWEFGLGSHANGMAVVSCQHADTTTIIAAGGNYASILGHYYAHSHHQKEDQVRILKELAENLGYTVSKKPTKRNIKTKEKNTDSNLLGILDKLVK